MQSEWQLVSSPRILVSILIHFSSAVVWKVLILSLISSSLSLFLMFLETVLKVLTIIGITITIFYNFFNSLTRSSYLSYFSPSLHSYSIGSWNNKIHLIKSSSLLNTWSGLLACIGWSVGITISKRILCLIFKNRFRLDYVLFFFFTSFEFYSSVLTGGFSLKSELQQISSGLQDKAFMLILTAVWMVLILSPVSSFLSLFSSVLGTIPRAPTTTGITITFIFYSFSALWLDPNICESFHLLQFSLDPLLSESTDS